MEIIIGILGILIGFGVAWLIIRILPQEKIREINSQNFEQYKKQQEEEIQEITNKKSTAFLDYAKICDQVKEVQHDIFLLSIEKETLSNDIINLNTNKQNLIEYFEQTKQDAEKTAQIFLEQQMALTQEQLDRALETIAIKYQNDEEAYRQAYLNAIKEYAEEFYSSMQEMADARNKAQTELNDLQNTVNIAVAAAKREEEKRQLINFYKLVLPDSDLNEIQQLRAVEPFLKDKEALNKVIWKVYYEKPYTDLIGRVVGTGVKTGIYKITNIDNQMCYVGQAVNIAERWKQHIKRGIGAESPTRNKLYPAMQSFGVENFSFEILEECSRDKLDTQEDYWQEFFHAKDFGYSIK